MTSWPPDSDGLRRPAYKSLAQSLVDAIEAGEVRPGDRLPTQRDLAHRLDISLQTVSRAYAELARLGVVAGRVGSGSYVTAGPLDARPPYTPHGRSDLIDCSILKPVQSARHREVMRRTLTALSRDLPNDVLFAFRPERTMSRHAQDALPWLARCGLAPEAEQVAVTNGATEAITTALMTAAGPGDLVLAEDMAHYSLGPLIRALGLRLEVVAGDAEGLCPEEMDLACRTRRVAAIYLLPNGAGTKARRMSEGRRAALAELARRHDLRIIENDAWGPVQPDMPGPIAGHAPERSFYITSLTKCLLAGLRIGYLVSPPGLAAETRQRHTVTSWSATPLMAELASRWIRDGTAGRLLRWQSAALKRRNRMATEALAGCAMQGGTHGLHLWLPLPDASSEEAVMRRTAEQGVSLAPGSAFALSARPVTPGVRLALGAASEPDLRRALGVVADSIRRAV